MQVKQSKHIAPLWQLPLQDVCRLMNSLGESWASEEEQEDAEVQTDYEQRVSGTLAQTLEEINDLKNLCRVLQPREVRINTHIRHSDNKQLTCSNTKQKQVTLKCFAGGSFVNADLFFSHLAIHNKG